MTISEMPRNKAKKPTQISSSASCTALYCWEAEHDAVVGAAQMAIGVVDIRDNLQLTG